MTINRKFLQLCRTVHIYLTLCGLGVLLFFGLTGFTVNHEEWFGATRPRVVERTGATPKDVAARNDRLAVVEHWRKEFHISGALTDLDAANDRWTAAFKEPGQLWEITLDPATGATKVHHEMFNFAAVLNNLHRGRYTGGAWSWVIDVSALLIVVACATGVVLWLVLPARRRLGIAALVLGTAVTLAIYAFLVPGGGGEPVGGTPTATATAPGRP